MAKINPLVKKYGKQKRWVNFKIQSRKGKKTKVPYSPLTGKMASSTDEGTWATYEEAKKKSENVGIVFTPDQKLLGIDIDHCLEKGTNNINHEKRQEIAELIIESNTYTEISPSGEGLHLYFELDKSLVLTGNKSAPYEIYTSGRYFTFTANCYKEEKPIRKISTTEALRILAILGYPFATKTSVSSEATMVHRNGGEAANSNSEGQRSVLSDEEVINKMFLSRTGRKIKELYEGSLAEYEGDASRGDMALLSHLAFWTRKDFDQMKRLWQSSPLGKREKTQTREDYVNRSVNAAIYNCKQVYETPKLRMESQHPDMDFLFRVLQKGEIEYLQNTENMCRILRKHTEFAGTLRYDAFKNAYEILEEGKWRTLEDNDAVNIQTRISIVFSDWFGKVGKDMVYDAIIKVCKENTIDSARDYIEALKWDGTKRLDLWLSNVYGVPPDAYHKAVASNWMKGLVKRIIEPGCKFDYVLVLEGEQGSRKSTSLYILGGDWHVESAMSTESKDFFMQFQGKAIVEFSEGETLSRTEVKRMKAIITMQSDKYRPPYERTSQDFPRRCVFAMTTNQTEYLKDETGNRRWLPVRLMLPQANVEWLIENRDQLFAEAHHRVVNMKESVHEFPVEETLKQQQLRRISDPNEGIITEWYMKHVDDDDQEKGITIHRVYKEALHGGFSSRPMSKFEEMSIATVLRDYLHLVRKQRMEDGVRVWVWVNERGKALREANDDAMAKAVREEKW